MRNGVLYRRKTPELGTCEKEFLSWATPTTRDYKDGKYCPNVSVNGLLGRQVWKLYPTVLANSWKHPSEDSNREGSQNLQEAVQAESGLGRAAYGFPYPLDTLRVAYRGQKQHEWEYPRTVEKRGKFGSKRLQRLGNTVVPQQAELAAGILYGMACEEVSETAFAKEFIDSLFS